MERKRTVREALERVERLRLAILARDKGICSLCGFDCFALWSALKLVVESIRSYRVGWSDMREQDFLRAVGDRAARWPKWTWEVDHRLPLAEGGTDDLDNLRTLCVACHKRETKRLFGGKGAKKKLMRRRMSRT